ncbi:MAG: type III pantothenate kinase [Oscillospiraceae bacterium]|nr:type III pantothenate kinase [Oscillospiraceae bacterium]
MILAVDIGNSSVIVGCADEKESRIIGRLAAQRQKTEDEYAVDLQHLMERNQLTSAEIEGAIVASVVPPMSDVIREAIRRVVGKRPLLVGPGVKTGLNILIDNPGQLGSGLVVNAVAAIEKYPKPLIVLDMSTATVVSVIDREGRYIGGMICPGVMISLEALASGTSQLPRIGLEAPEKVVGRNTVDAIKSGAIYGSAAMIDGLIARIEEELGEEATLVSTGRLSARIVPYCTRKIIYDESLLMRGLWLIWKKNQ